MIITCILGFILGRKLAQNVETKRPKYESANLLVELFRTFRSDELETYLKSLRNNKSGMIGDMAFEYTLDFLEMVACFRNDGCLNENHFDVYFKDAFTHIDKNRFEQFNGRYPNIKRLLQ